MPRWSARAPFGDPDDLRGFPALLARYLEALAVRHGSPTTIRSREHVVRLFAAWCVERGVERPGEVSRAVLERYQRWLFHYRSESGKAYRLGTQHSRLLGIRLFFGWLAQERYLAADPASALLLPKKPPRLPTDTFNVTEVEEILAVPDLSTALGLLDRAILETLYSTGIRRSELVRLDVYDLDHERGCLVVRQGKGGKDRVVPIGERALAWVVRYLEAARGQLVVSPIEQALFVSGEGERFTPGGLGARVRRVIEHSSVRERVGACHLFRHTCATLMLEGGADVRFIQEMLGHASLDSTQIYTKVSIQKLKAIHSATHPGAKLERKTPTEPAATLEAR